jgi:DNA modification methylase
VIHYEGHGVQVRHGDCLDVLRELPDCSVDSVVTDPPYGLEFMGKEWDAPWKADGTVLHDPSEVGGFQDGNGGNPYSRSRVRFGFGLGFQQWCEQWAAECLRVLKPGGHLLAFGGSRTYHRLTSGVEDAGFEIRDCITWHFGSGFPKSLDVSKAIDRRPGVVHHRQFAAELRQAREQAGLSTMDVSEAVMETSSGACWNWENHQFPSAAVWPRLRDLLSMDGEKWDPIFAEAERKEVGTIRNNQPGGTSAFAQGGIGAYVRGDTTERAVLSAEGVTPDAQRWQGWGTALKPATEFIVVARKPLTGTVAATVLEHGTGALNIDACRVGLPHGDPLHDGITGRDGRAVDTTEQGWGFKAVDRAAGLGRWPANVVFDEHQAAALDEMSGERPSGKPQNRYTSGDKFGGTPYGEGLEQRTGWATSPGYVDDGGASRFFYVAKADATERPRVNGTSHPTVKPLALMRWLVRLVTPPGGTVLEPFAGSGTTVEACIVEGFRCIAIEKTDEYLPLIMARIHRRRDPVEAIKLAGEELGLFDLDGLGA